MRKWEETGELIAWSLDGVMKLSLLRWLTIWYAVSVDCLCSKNHSLIFSLIFCPAPDLTCGCVPSRYVWSVCVGQRLCGCGFFHSFLPFLLNSAEASLSVLIYSFLKYKNDNSTTNSIPICFSVCWRSHSRRFWGAFLSSFFLSQRISVVVRLIISFFSFC